MKHLNNQKGFTLIELIIVIVVLGVLAAVAIPNYVNMQQDAQAASNYGWIAGVRSTVSIDFAGQRIGKTVGAGANQVCLDSTTVLGPALPAGTTGAAAAACVTGTAPASLTLAGNVWTGLSPAIASGAAPANQSWTLAAGTAAGNPIRLTCSSATVQC